MSISNKSTFAFKIYLLLSLLILFLLLDIFFGTVNIPLHEIINILMGKDTGNSAWRTIILDFRLPKALTAVLAGCALSVCGLQMQTIFRNPLAGPFVLGITSGASLGVGLVLLTAGTSLGGFLSSTGVLSKMGIVLSASIGAGTVLLLVVVVSKKIGDSITLLILGLMFGHITGALQSVLVYFSTAENIQGFVLWELGNFSNVLWEEMSVLAPAVLLGLVLSFGFSKTLNALLLGDNYASSMGIKVSAARLGIITVTGLLAGGITAFCGPIAFLGMAVPHLARALFNTSDHAMLIPATSLIGSALALLCDILTQLPGGSEVLPVNAVTSLIGAPVVIWVILRQKNLKYSF